MPSDNKPDEVVTITSSSYGKEAEPMHEGKRPVEFGSSVPQHRFAQDRPPEVKEGNVDEPEEESHTPPPGSTMGYHNKPAFRGQFSKDSEMLSLGAEKLESFCLSDPEDQKKLDELNKRASGFDPLIVLQTLRTDFHEGKHYVLVRHQDIFYPYYDHDYRDSILASFQNQ